ncbi:MFS transporter, partial [Bacillus sp. RHFS18]|nr:MFS transporter [Bacillus sp. RHFS18]
SENGTTIAAAVSVSAFNLANALGAWIGGLILGGTGSYSWLFAGGALMTALGLVLSTFAHLSEKKDVYEYQVHKG